MDLPEKHIQYFHHLDSLFSSVENLIVQIDNHLLGKPNETIGSFVHFHTMMLFEFEIELRHTTDEVRLENILKRLKYSSENCDLIIQEARGSLVEYLSGNAKKNQSEIRDFLRKIRPQNYEFVSGIEDEGLRDRVLPYYASLLFQQYLDTYTDRFSRLFFRASRQSKISSTMHWLKTDADFLELAIALYESHSIDNISRDLTQKGAIEFLSGVFNMKITNLENTSNTACDRKNNSSSFLADLKIAFDNYCRNIS